MIVRMFSTLKTQRLEALFQSPSPFQPYASAHRAAKAVSLSRFKLVKTLAHGERERIPSGHYDDFTMSLMALKC